MLDVQAGAGSDRLNGMHLVLLAFKSTEGELYGIEARLEVS